MTEDRHRAEAVSVPDGWKLVPIEPLPGMIDAACMATVLGEGEDDEPVHLEPREARIAYASMLAAAPTPPSPAVPVKQEPVAVPIDLFEDLRMGAVSIRRWMPEALPANEQGQVCFERAIAESAAEAIEAVLPFLAATPPSDELAELRAENDAAKREARILAQSMWEQSYSDVTEWRMLDDTAGIITQISNMAAGIRDRATAAEAKAEKLAQLVERARQIISTSTYPNWHNDARAALGVKP